MHARVTWKAIIQVGQAIFIFGSFDLTTFQHVLILFWPVLMLLYTETQTSERRRDRQEVA